MQATDALDAGHAVTIELEETLDASAVLQAREILERAPSWARLVIDVTRARNVDWFALATLVVALVRQPAGRVTLRGLCEHHLRLMRQLGIDVDRLLGRTQGPPPGDDVETAPGAGRLPPAALASPQAAGAQLPA